MGSDETHILKKLIFNRHDISRGEWVGFDELRNGTGFINDRYIDVAAFNCWPSKRFSRIAYEIKSSRADFKREIETPKKKENGQRKIFIKPTLLFLRG